MRPKHATATPQDDLFRARLENLIDLRHPLARLATGLADTLVPVSGADFRAAWIDQVAAAACRTRSGSGGMGMAPGTRNRSPR